MADNRQQTLFSWSSLSALNNQPTVLYGLTLNELFICIGAGLITSIVVFVFAVTLIGNTDAALIISGVMIFLSSYIYVQFLGRYKKKYGAQMYQIHLLKKLQKYGVWNSGLEITRKEWIGTRSKRF
ncbi:DUF3487 family protein [Photobacterium sp. GB-72]|uniref:DUF3487 family protein n=1 Tax=Photobacterium sp. GB-72 TaxID=2022105 RepID=UPI000D1708FA|nr:DUF3487 family protein [Photobacterium sp. GB-72]PSV28061.1 hypothetical protein C9J40_19470 [Photobacterium sp. GB-72]